MIREDYEQGGTYARAEDELFALLESAHGHADAIGMGEAFYERLLALDDATLDAGGLPQAEVEAGLAEIHKTKVG